MDCQACQHRMKAYRVIREDLDRSTVFRKAILAAPTPWHARKAAAKAKAAGWNFDRTALACRLIELRREAFRIRED